MLLRKCQVEGCETPIFHDDRHRIGNVFACDECRARAAGRAVPPAPMPNALGREVGIPEHEFVSEVEIGRAYAWLDEHDDVVRPRDPYAESVKNVIGDLATERDLLRHALCAAIGPEAMVALGFGLQEEPARCRVCGCTEDDCRGCIERTGQPCSWYEPDLCTACVPAATEARCSCGWQGDAARADDHACGAQQ
jgi:hypothetical protein